ADVHTPGREVAADGLRTEPQLEALVANRADVLEDVDPAAVDGRGDGDREDLVLRRLPVRGHADRQAVIEEVRVESALELLRALRLESRVAEEAQSDGRHRLAVDDFVDGGPVQSEPVDGTGLATRLPVREAQTQRVEDLRQRVREERFVGDQVGRTDLRECRQLQACAKRAPTVETEPGREPE